MLFILFAAPSILSVAFLFMIQTLCTTGSGGGETGGEEDRERVGAAAGGGEARGRTSGVTDTTALPGRIGEGVEHSSSFSPSVILLFTHIGSSPSLTKSLLVSQGDLLDQGLAILAFIWEGKKTFAFSQVFFSAKTANSLKNVLEGHLGRSALKFTCQSSPQVFSSLSSERLRRRSIPVSNSDNGIRHSRPNSYSTSALSTPISS